MILKQLTVVQLPVLIDDETYSYLILGMQYKYTVIETEEKESKKIMSDVRYLIGDPHYGLLYGTRDPSLDWNEIGRKSMADGVSYFDYGSDEGKYQWRDAQWFEKNTNGNTTKTWMMLFCMPSSLTQNLNTKHKCVFL